MSKKRCQTGDRLSNVKTQLCPRGYLPTDYRVRGRVCCSKSNPKTVKEKKPKCAKGQRVASVAGTCPKGFERSGRKACAVGATCATGDASNGRACCHRVDGAAEARAYRNDGEEHRITEEVVAEVKNDMLDFVLEAIRPEHQQKLSIIGLAVQQLQDKTTAGVLGQWISEFSSYMKVHLEALGVSEDQVQGWFLEYVDFVTYFEQLTTNKVALSPAAEFTLKKYTKLRPQFENALVTLYTQLNKLAPSRFNLRTSMNKFIKLRAQMTKLERQFMSEVEVYSRTTSFVTSVTLQTVLDVLKKTLIPYVLLVNSTLAREATWSWIKMNTGEGVVRDLLGEFFRHRTDIIGPSTLLKYMEIFWTGALPTETKMETTGYIPEGRILSLTLDYTSKLHLNVVRAIMHPLKYLGLDSTTLSGISTVLLFLYLLTTRGWPLVRYALSSLNVQDWWDIQKIRQDITRPVRGFRCSPRHVCLPVYSSGSKQVEYKNLDECATHCHTLHGGYVAVSSSRENTYLGFSFYDSLTF